MQRGCRLHADKETLRKRRLSRRTGALLRSPVEVSPRVAERWCSKAASGDLDALVRLGGRDARAVTEHWRRSNRLCRCYARGRFVAEARDAWQKIACAGSWGPPALLAVRLRMLRKRHVLAAAGSSRGCPHKASIVGWPRNAASTLSAGWARRVTTNKWFQPKGAYSRMPVEGRRFPVA